MVEVSMSRSRINLHASSVNQIYLDAETGSGVGVRIELGRGEAEAVGMRLFELSRGHQLGPAKPSLSYDEVTLGLAGPFTYCMVSREGSIAGDKCYRSAYDALAKFDFARPGHTVKPLYTKEFVIAFRDEALNNYKAAQAANTAQIGLWHRIKCFVRGIIG